MRNRFVKINRRKQGDTTFYFYMPVELRNGNLYALAQPSHPEGFDKPSEAWNVINRIEEREAVAHG